MNTDIYILKREGSTIRKALGRTKKEAMQSIMELVDIAYFGNAYMIETKYTYSGNGKTWYASRLEVPDNWSVVKSQPHTVTI